MNNKKTSDPLDDLPYDAVSELLDKAIQNNQELNERLMEIVPQVLTRVSVERAPEVIERLRSIQDAAKAALAEAQLISEETGVAVGHMAEAAYTSIDTDDRLKTAKEFVDANRLFFQKEVRTGLIYHRVVEPDTYQASLRKLKTQEPDKFQELADLMNQVAGEK